MYNLRLCCCCEGKKILGEKVTNMKYVWDRGFLLLLLGTWPSDHQHPGFFDYLQIKFFFIQWLCCNFSFSLYPHLWRKKMWKFRAMLLETNYDISYISHITYIIDKLFVKIWSNIAPDISGRGAACYCHFQAPGENKNIPSHSRHLR